MPDAPLSLRDLGWTDELESTFAPFRFKGFAPARVAIEDKHHYVVLTANGARRAQASGRLLHETEAKGDLPKVGDWVAVAVQPGRDHAIIRGLLPRRTRLSRKIPGRETREQVLVTNIDRAFVVQALDRTFNARLLERYLLMILEGGAQPVIVLNKADLSRNIDEAVARARQCAVDAPIITASAVTSQGIGELKALLGTGITAVFVGTSGVGKSSLINALYGEDIQATAEVRESDDKGRHTTTWREMILLPGGGLVIDTPGMREFHLWMAGDGVQDAFPDIGLLAVGCKFRDCTHTNETGCAVLEALSSNQLARDRYEGFVKLRRELGFLSEAHRRHQAITQRVQRQRQKSSPRRVRFEPGEEDD
jgi:ribosome biogenesis GTPase